jgi:surface antigen
LHERNLSGIRAAASVLSLALLAGCAYLPLDMERLKLQKPPPEIALKRGGPTGEVLSGPVLPALSDEAADASIGETLRPWLTPIERHELADASQHAAIALTGSPVAWQAVDGANSVTSTGEALAMGAPYRSVRGRICRDLTQSVTKSGELRQQPVTLCRDEPLTGPTFWVLGQRDQ